MPDRCWVDEVATALAEGRVLLYRQRIVTRWGLQRFEVLARLMVEGQVLNPVVWMPALEGEPDLFREFDLWVLRSVLERGLDSREQVWINVCGHSVTTGFAALVGGLLDKHSLPARQLCVEITESVAMGPGYRQELRNLRALGIDIAIDDLGAGHSNLKSLEALPYNWLKIDGGLLASPRKLKVAKHLCLLGKELGMGVVAEWVETQAQALLLWRWGCDGLQGFNVPKVGEGKPQIWKSEVSIRARGIEL